MYKFAVLLALFACAMAAPEPQPGFVASSVPVATSYANTVKISSSYKAPVVAAPVAYAAAPVVAHAPVYAHAPIVASAPVYAHHAVAAAPLVAHSHVFVK